MMLQATLAGMHPPDFLQAVLTLKRLNANALARKINSPTSQGTISKFLNGDVKDPRGAWVRPAAKYLGIDAAALRDDEVADREALRLGLLGFQGKAPTPIRKAREVSAIDPGMLALQIGDLMRGFTPAQREVAAPLFQGAAKDPAEAPAIAAALRALLGKRNGTNG